MIDEAIYWPLGEKYHVRVIISTFIFHNASVMLMYSHEKKRPTSGTTWGTLAFSIQHNAAVAKSVDATDLESGGAPPLKVMSRAGANPVCRTT
jgi:hypothetical protein